MAPGFTLARGAALDTCFLFHSWQKWMASPFASFTDQWVECPPSVLMGSVSVFIYL